MPSKQINIRLPEYAVKTLDKIVKRLGTTQVNAVAKALDHLERDTKGYNGWVNYETWAVALWLDNEQSSYYAMLALTESAYDDAEGDKDDALGQLAKAINEYIDDRNPLASDASMFSDLLGAAMSEVDYHEIAEHYLADYEPDED